MSDDVPRFTAEGLLGRPLRTAAAPKRLAIVRLHAFGDTVGVLPVVGGLRDRYPDCRIDVVTGPPSVGLFHAHRDVESVHVLDARASRLRRTAALVRIARALRSARLDAVLDLQRSRLSRILVALVRPPAYAEFDRFAPEHGLARYLAAAARLGLEPLSPVLTARIRPGIEREAERLLSGAGHDTERPLICLNPAGGWVTKRWPLERYAELGRRLVREAGAQVLLLGAGPELPRVRALGRDLGSPCVDLTGRTTPDLAMAAIARAALIVSDDSGLMHLAWTQGVPTLAIFGASRATWCRPLGDRTDGFYSEDLACGACMRSECARGDVHCMGRVEVAAVLGRALELLAESGRIRRGRALI